MVDLVTWLKYRTPQDLLREETRVSSTNERSRDSRLVQYERNYWSRALVRCVLEQASC